LSEFAAGFMTSSENGHSFAVSHLVKTR
jgi:hypothetical protein